MFGKLLKHDFIATGRVMCIVYEVFAAVALYLVGSVALSKELDSLGEMLGYIVLCLISFANFVVTAAVVMINFQKSVYGDQGYLTFTLPVKSESILFSKMFVSIFWYIAAFLAFLSTARIALWSMGEMMGEEGIGLAEMLLGMVQEGLSVKVLIVYAITYIIQFFFLVVTFTMIAYFAITVSNTRPFQKHYIIFTILFLAIVGIAVLKIMDIVMDHIHIGFNYSYATEKLKFAVGTDAMVALAHIDIAVPIALILISVGLFFGTYILMKKKINIR